MEIKHTKNQKFTKLGDGKVLWENFKEVKDFEDESLGKVGVTSGKDEVTFDSKEQAMAVLDKDYVEVKKFVDQYQEEMQKNEHNLDKFSELKDLTDKIAELNGKLAKVTGESVQKLYADNPKKYQKLLREFNSAKEYVKDDLGVLASEYKKYQAYETAKKNYEFCLKDLERTQEQKDRLREL